MYYAKSDPAESIKKHTEKLLENLKLLRKTYEKEISENIQSIGIEVDRFWYLLELVCRYHDIGKVYTPFQNLIRVKLGMPLIQTEFAYEKTKHEQLSPMFVPVDKLNLSKEEKKLVYQTIYYHHEREHKEIDSVYIQEIINKDILPQIDKIKEEIGYEIEENLRTRYTQYVNERNRIVEGNNLYPAYCILKGMLHRLDYSSSADIEIEDDTTENVEENTKYSIEKQGYNLNKLQEFCDIHTNDNLLVIGSTGIGKTESALIWSNGAKTFFTLPIRISINAIYDRIMENINYKHVGLLHSTALEYLEEKNELENEEEKVNLTRNLHDKITVCTIDQLLPFVFKYKGYERILATLSYSKLIIDEIQAYSPNIVAIIIKGLEMISKVGGKFMVMTATLPRIYKEELEKLGVKIEFAQFVKPIKRHKIKMLEREICEDIDTIIEKGSNSKVLIIVNTVNKAIELYLKFKKLEVNDVSLLHSRFIYRDRNCKEDEIKKFSKEREKSGIWITTQIVEASLDIDFDYLFTEMSTLDSLFQRLGRCYRSREYIKEEENIYIYTKGVSGIKYVYDEEIHGKSVELLKRFDGKVLEEEEKIDLVDKLYSRDMLEGTNFLKEFDEGLEVLNNIIDYKTDKATAQKLLRNIDNITVIPKKIYEENISLFEQYESLQRNYKERNKLKRKIDKLTVSIMQGQKRKLRDRLVENPYCKDIFIVDAKYDNDVGLVIEKDEEYELDEKFL